MEARYNVTGPERKTLVKEISRITGIQSEYMRMPTCSYQIGDFTVTRNGALIYDDKTDTGLVQQVLRGLADAGFACETPMDAASEPDNRESDGSESNDAVPADTEPDDAESAPQNNEESAGTTAQPEMVKLNIQMPRSAFTDTALDNLRKLIEAKTGLIQKALAVESLPIAVDDDRVSFPWFGAVEADDVQAYTHFVTALCGMAEKQKRVTAREKAVDNEKYTFRCFLLRLGFIGKDYKEERKILLRNLTGSSAFKGGERREASES